MLRRVVTLLYVSAMFCGCAGSNRPPVEALDAWSPAAPPGAAAAAVYLKVRAYAPDTLLGASTPVADQAEMHTTTQVDGMMQMRPLEGLDLAAGESAEFEPGGRHLMLTGLHQPLAVGAQFPLTLRFAKAGERVVQVKVIAPGAAPDR